LADSAGGGFCGPFAQEGSGFTPIVLLPKFAQFLFEQVGALERLIDFQASLQSLGGVLFQVVPAIASAFGFRDDDFLKLRLYALHEAKFTFVG
jgi:hypothetical protein